MKHSAAPRCSKRIERCGKFAQSDLYPVRRLGGAVLMPRAEGALWIGIDQINRPIPGALGFNGKVGAQAGLAAAALLRVDHDCLHGSMLDWFHGRMQAWRIPTLPPVRSARLVSLELTSRIVIRSAQA